MFVIEIHNGFMIAGYEAKYRNCLVTAKKEDALTFKTKTQARAFIREHHDEGTNMATNKIIELYDGLKNLEVIMSEGNCVATPMFIEKISRIVGRLAQAKTTNASNAFTMRFVVNQCKLSSAQLKSEIKSQLTDLIKMGFSFRVRTLK